MKTRAYLLTCLLAPLIAIGAQANITGAILKPARIASIIKSGKTSARELVEMRFYNKQPSKHALLGTFARRGKSDVHLFVSRINNDSGLDTLKIHLVTSLDESVEAAVKNRFANPTRHSRFGEVADQALTDSELARDGEKIMEALVGSGLVEVTERPIGAIQRSITTQRRLGLNVDSQMSGAKGEVLLDQNRLEKVSYLGLQNFDLRYIENLSDLGPAAAFEIRMGISKRTTAEQLSRILEVVSDAASRL